MARSPISSIEGKLHGADVYIIGTAHISAKSAADVEVGYGGAWLDVVQGSVSFLSGIGELITPARETSWQVK